MRNHLLLVLPCVLAACDVTTPQGDASAPDLAAQPDLAAPDLARAPDLVMVPDLVTVPDLVMVPDLATTPDLSTLPDLAPLRQIIDDFDATTGMWTYFLMGGGLAGVEVDAKSGTRALHLVSPAGSCSSSAGSRAGVAIPAWAKAVRYSQHGNLGPTYQLSFSLSTAKLGYFEGSKDAPLSGFSCVDVALRGETADVAAQLFTYGSCQQLPEQDLWLDDIVFVADDAGCTTMQLD